MNRDKKTGILLGAVAVLLVIVVGLGIFLIGMKLGQKKGESRDIAAAEDLPVQEETPALTRKPTAAPTEKPTPTAAPTSTPTQAPTAVPTQPSSVSSDSYRIDAGLREWTSQGLVFLQGDYITLYVNAEDYNNGLIGWEANAEGDSLKIYYPKAHDSGHGGTVVTLMAFDWGENGYENFPNYKIACLTENKKYIAMFPTDVQYNPNDSVQAEEYARLRQWASNIDQDNSSNPFSTHE